MLNVQCCELATSLSRYTIVVVETVEERPFTVMIETPCGCVWPVINLTKKEL